MKCPLRSVGTHEPEEICGIQTFDCLQSDCAIYDQLQECCDIHVISISLRALSSEAGKIARELSRLPSK